jgi:hypothetical protein
MSFGTISPDGNVYMAGYAIEISISNHSIRAHNTQGVTSPRYGSSLVMEERAWIESVSCSGVGISYFSLIRVFIFNLFTRGTVLSDSQPTYTKQISKTNIDTDLSTPQEHQ